MIRYIIFIDILGYYALAENIASEKKIDSDVVRQEFHSTIESRIKTLIDQNMVKEKDISRGPDHWILILDRYLNIFLGLYQILDHDSGFHGYEEIPLEIGIGVLTSNADPIFNQQGKIFKKEVIKKLKAYLTHYYCEYYKQKYGTSVTNTFLVLEEELFNNLEPLDRAHCEFIQYRNHNKNTHCFYKYDRQKMLQRGLVYSFLDSLGFNYGSKTYDRIDEHFIAPLEYEIICQTLKEKRVVILVGLPELGKTYTAIHLLWDYYSRGDYTPRWIRGGEEKSRQNVRTQLEDIRTYLTPHSIVYFEDPFGKIQYEGRESLERNFSVIIKEILIVPDVFIIITSRDEVYKEFKKRTMAVLDFSLFEIILNLETYSSDKRKELLQGYAKIHQAQWNKDEKLTKEILRLIPDPNILPTPLTIRNFVISTTSIIDSNEILSQIHHNSQETISSFALEIQEMSLDKILLLSLIYIGSVPLSALNQEYNEFVNYLGIDEMWEFNKSIEWFKRDKVEISDDLVHFSHPSYFLAFRTSLVEKNGHFSKINTKIYSEILLKWSETEETAPFSYAKVDTDFEIIPPVYRERIIINFMRTYLNSAVLLVFKHFTSLPEELRKSAFQAIKDPIIAENLVSSFYLGYYSKSSTVRSLPAKILNDVFQVLKILLNTEKYSDFLFYIVDIPELTLGDYSQVFLRIKDPELIMYVIAYIIHRDPEKLEFLQGILDDYSINLLIEGINWWLKTNYGGVKLFLLWEVCHCQNAHETFLPDNFVTTCGKIMSKIKARTVIWLLLWLCESHLIDSYSLPNTIIPDIDTYLNVLDEILEEFGFNESNGNLICQVFHS